MLPWKFYWWLVRGTLLMELELLRDLLMELELLRDFFGNFWARGERYYFCMGGSMQDGCKVRMSTQGENVHMR